MILNGAPRSGKSSIVTAMQERLEGVWVNLGVDSSIAATPADYRPGIGLRPGGERPDLEPVVASFYSALFESAAAHSRLGLNVAMDLGIHDHYSQPLGVWRLCAERFDGLPVLLVGVRCPIETILQRRASETAGYVKGTEEDPVPRPVALWQEAVHQPGIYDLEVDTSLLSPEECADQIGRRLAEGLRDPSALERIRSSPQPSASGWE